APNGRIALVRRNGTAAIVHVGSASDPTPLASFGRLAGDDELTGAFSPSGDRVVTSAANGTRLWNAATGARVARLGRADQGFGDDGRLVLVVFGDRATVFTAADGTLLRSRPGAFGAISPDGTLAAKATDTGGVRIIDLTTGAATALQTDTTLPLGNLAFASSP